MILELLMKTKNLNLNPKKGQEPLSKMTQKLKQAPTKSAGFIAVPNAKILELR